MLLRISDWERIRENFTEMEKKVLNESIQGETICPRGCIIAEDTSVAVKVKKLVNELSEHDYWAVRDLALCHYPGKWRAAKDHASILYATYSHKWWMAARKYYLELGGEYKEQLPGRAGA